MKKKCYSKRSQIKKPELLSPAGNMESLFAAIENGADAVYFGLKDFSARASALNFSLDDAGKAIASARKKYVKVYIAFNTLIKTIELERAVDLLTALEEIQPDAIIIQDLGLLYLIQSQFPQFTLHASTQMAIHNLAGVKQMEQLGFKRVVLARELSVAEIKHISANTSIEIEVFVHGALCYSYSGLCFFSSIIGGRSGNRGKCAQPCRMDYHSGTGEKGHFFSMKDLTALSGINDLAAAGADSLKIEGRMKSPEYVAVTTNAYRKAIDGRLSDIEDEVSRIKTVFSRETTSAYLMENNSSGTDNGPGIVRAKPADMVNLSYPANMGLYAGEVIKSEKNYVVIRAEADIGVRDLLQVFENASSKPALLHVKTIKVKGKRVFGIKAGDIASINSEKRITKGANIYVVSSQKTKEMLAQKVPKKLVPVPMMVNLEVKIMPDNIAIKGTVGQFLFSKDCPVKLERSIQHVTGKDDIKGCFSRLGDTPFELDVIHVDVPGGLFVPLSILNKIRRDYFSCLLTAWRKEREQRCLKTKKWLKGIFVKCGIDKTNGLRGNVYGNEISENEVRLSLKIDRLEYLDYVPIEDIKKIYIMLTGKTSIHLQKDNDIAGLLLKRKDKIVFSLPAIMRDIGNGIETYDYFKKAVQKLRAKGFGQFQISNPGAMGLFDGEDVILYADSALYTLNPLSKIKLQELGFHRSTLSPEDGKENLQMLFSENADLIIYQDVPLFTSETCVWANMKGVCPGVARCNVDRMGLENEHGDRFTAVNEACRTVVIGESTFSIIHHVQTLLEAGQRDFRIDLCYKEYTPEMIHSIFSGIQNRESMKDSTIGNFERGLL